jgi:hypothetical protein
VTALGAEANVEVEMGSKQATSNTVKAVGTAAAVGAAVLSVYVIHGAARVEAHPPNGQPVLLAAGDRALLMNGAPPLALRTGGSTPESTEVAVRAALASSTAPAHDQRPVLPPLPPTVKANPPPPSAPPPTIDDKLDKDTIRAGVQSVLPRITECYERQLESHPNLGGKIVMSFKIVKKDGKGRIDEAEIIPGEGQEDLNSPATEHCLLGVMTDAEFPAPAGDEPVLVHYPFILQRE